jgi:hypothetical protein
VINWQWFPGLAAAGCPNVGISAARNPEQIPMTDPLDAKYCALHDVAPAVTLLHGMSQLVREQPPSLVGVGPVFPGPENDMTIDCEGPRIDGPRQMIRVGAGMDPHRIEPRTKARLKEQALLCTERLAPAFQRLQAGSKGSGRSCRRQCSPGSIGATDGSSWP